MNFIALILAALALFASGALLFGAFRWQAKTKTIRTRLESARLPVSSSVYDAREIEPLPPPVRRYFRAGPWYPTALLPSQGVHWEAMDDSTAKQYFEGTKETQHQ